MAKSNVEARLAALEKEVAELKLRLAEPAKPEIPWWEKIAGTFANDPEYEDAMRIGREYRESLRPKPKKAKKSKNDRS